MQSDDVAQSKNTRTQIYLNTDAKRKLFDGMEIAAAAVGTTLGPKGKTVIIQKDGESPIVTKDGVTVSKSIKLKDPIMRMGAELIREAAAQTNEIAGDGTTTATILTHAMVKEGLKLLESGYSAKELCSGLECAYEHIDVKLQEMAKKLVTSAEIAQVGTISANGDSTVGKLIAEAMEQVGSDGIITVEDAKGMSTTLDFVEGMQFDRGYLSPYFVTNSDKMNAAYPDARVLITDKKLTSLQELIPILEKIVQARQSMVIIADDVEGEALQGLVLNRVNANLQVVAVKAPGYGQHRSELLNDIAVMTGAKIASASTGLKIESLQLSDLGTTKKVIVDARTTMIVGTGATAAAIDKHVLDLQAQLKDVTLSVNDVLKLRMRIARLANGVAIIKVGGATEVEMIERKYRIEDALNATKAAAAEGIVPGGGMALFGAYEAAKTVLNDLHVDRDTTAGIDIIRSACCAPLRRIIENAGKSPDVIVHELSKRPDVGYNAATDEFVDVIAAGIIDPCRVTRTALKNAVSVATTFISLGAIIVEEEC